MMNCCKATIEFVTFLSPFSKALLKGYSFRQSQRLWQEEIAVALLPSVV